MKPAGLVGTGHDFCEINLRQWIQMRTLLPSWCAGSCRTKGPLSPSDHLVGWGATPVWPLFHLHQLAYQKPTQCATINGVSIRLRAKHKTKIESSKKLPFVIWGLFLAYIILPPDFLITNHYLRNYGYKDQKIKKLLGLYADVLINNLRKY